MLGLIHSVNVEHQWKPQNPGRLYGSVLEKRTMLYCVAAAAFELSGPNLLKWRFDKHISSDNSVITYCQTFQFSTSWKSKELCVHLPKSNNRLLCGAPVRQCIVENRTDRSLFPYLNTMLSSWFISLSLVLEALEAGHQTRSCTCFIPTPDWSSVTTRMASWTLYLLCYISFKGLFDAVYLYGPYQTKV